MPDAPFPDPATPAPPRFLAEYDNVLLAHADRSRMLLGLGPGQPWPTGRWIGSLLVDGFFRAWWKVDDATLTIDRFAPQPDDPPGRSTRSRPRASGCSTSSRRSASGAYASTRPSGRRGHLPQQREHLVVVRLR